MVMGENSLAEYGLGSHRIDGKYAAEKLVQYIRFGGVVRCRKLNYTTNKTRMQRSVGWRKIKRNIVVLSTLDER